jgi:hypothetical protein
MKLPVALTEALAALHQVQARQITSASPICSGTLGQILQRLGMTAPLADQCATCCEVLEELGIPPTPETLVECLAELPDKPESLEINPQSDQEEPHHPDPFFNAVNYNRKRYGITAINHQTNPPIVFQDWRDADECQREKYEILDAWDSVAKNYLSPKEIQARLRN